MRLPGPCPRRGACCCIWVLAVGSGGDSRCFCFFFRPDGADGLNGTVYLGPVPSGPRLLAGGLKPAAIRACLARERWIP